VRWNGRLLVDGGVVNNTPISHAVELGARQIYVLPTQAPTSRGLSVPPRGALDLAVHAFTLLVGARLRMDVARYATRVELIVLPAPNPDRIQPTDFDHADWLIDGALQAARRTLDDIPASEVLLHDLRDSDRACCLSLPHLNRGETLVANWYYGTRPALTGEEESPPFARSSRGERRDSNPRPPGPQPGARLHCPGRRR
jgi:predicted acylesterase/phospholipase RssA